MSISLGVKIEDTDAVIPRMATFVAGLRPSGRVGLNRAIGAAAMQLTRAHLIGIAQTRHKTAENLGASPTGHWGQAAEKTTATANAEGATVTIKQPGIGRVAHDVVILPGPGKKFLTIPVIAAAYGQRAYRVKGLIAIVTGNRGVLMMPQKGVKSATGGKFGTVWYVLTARVKQRQDRTLLPDDAAYQKAALVAARLSIKLELMRRGAREATT